MIHTIIQLALSIGGFIIIYEIYKLINRKNLKIDYALDVYSWMEEIKDGKIDKENSIVRVNFLDGKKLDFRACHTKYDNLISEKVKQIKRLKKDETLIIDFGNTPFINKEERDLIKKKLKKKNIKNVCFFSGTKSIKINK